jgi:putative ABC transport system ATP-binding protein
MSVISIHNLVKTYPLGHLSVQALKGVSLEITAGDFVSVAGPSGSGKTTIMNIISLIDTPSKGQVYINDRDTAVMNRRELTRLRHEEIGIVFQSFNLLPVLNVMENVELPLVIGKTRMPKAERREWVNHLLEEVGLEDRLGHKPSELSGGQQQRFDIARALATQPRIVIADEPTANLDTATGERVLEVMKTINKAEGTTFIFSTHDPGIWERADHVVFLRDGLIESEKRR